MFSQVSREHARIKVVSRAGAVADQHLHLFAAIEIRHRLRARLCRQHQCGDNYGSSFPRHFALPRTLQAIDRTWMLSEQQRLDNHNDDVADIDDGSDIHIIELLELNAIDGDDIGAGRRLEMDDTAKT